MLEVCGTRPFRRRIREVITSSPRLQVDLMETEFQPRCIPQTGATPNAPKQAEETRPYHPEMHPLPSVNTGDWSEQSVKNYLRQKSREVRHFTQAHIDSGLGRAYQAEPDKKSRIRKVNMGDIQVIQNAP